MSKYTARTCNGCHEKFGPKDSYQAYPRKRRAYHPRCMVGGDTTCRRCKGSGWVLLGAHGDLWSQGFRVFTHGRCTSCNGFGFARRAA